MTDTIALGGGTTVRVVAARDEATLLELALEPGAGAGPHTHTREDETMAVLAGRLLVDDGERARPSGRATQSCCSVACATRS